MEGDIRREGCVAPGAEAKMKEPLPKADKYIWAIYR